MIRCNLPPSVDPKDARSLRGARARAEGEAFEDLLEWIHKTYLSAGRAALYHNKLAAHRVGSDEMVAEKQSRPDFSGTLPGGLAIHFDAKTTESTVGWRLPKKRRHQFEMLRDQARMGAVAFFLVECRPEQAVYLLRVRGSDTDYDRIEIMFDGSAPVFSGDSKYRLLSAPLICVQAEEGGAYDWLAAVEACWAPAREFSGAAAPEPYRGRKPGPRKSPNIVERNRKIVERYMQGEKPKNLAAEFGLCNEYIYQILRADPRASVPDRRRRRACPPGTGKTPVERPPKDIAGVRRGKLARDIRVRGDSNPLKLTERPRGSHKHQEKKR